MICKITIFFANYFQPKKIRKIRKILRMKKIRKIRILDLWHEVFDHDGSNGVTAIFVTWPEVTSRD